MIFDLSNVQDVTAACQLLTGGVVSPNSNPWWGQTVFAGAADNEADSGNRTTRASILTPLGCPAGSWLWKATLADVRAYLATFGIDN